MDKRSILRRGGAVSLAVAMGTLGALVPSAAGAARATHASRGEHVGSASAAATISRDRYGVPTITSSTMAGMWFGAGWAQAEDRMVQLELTRRDVEGTLAAVCGSTEVSSDEGIRNLYYTPSELTTELSHLPAADQVALQDFSNGINAYEAKAYSSAANEKTLVPYEFWVVGTLLQHRSGPYRPAPWQPIDTVAVGNFLAREFGGGGGSEMSNLAFDRYLHAELSKKGDKNASADARAIFDDSRWINDPTAPTTVPPSVSAATSTQTALSGATAAIGRATARSLAALSSVSNQALLRAESKWQSDRRLILAVGVSLKVPSHGGSNAFVVTPSRSKSHTALLWGAPQEGLGTPSVDGEEYLHGPGYDAGGMDITGEPFILIGRNADISWTTTSEELVDDRIYVEHIRRVNGVLEYRWKGGWKPMLVLRELIKVAGAKPIVYTVLRTGEGPVFMVDGKVAFSARFASWKHEYGSLAGFAGLGADHNLTQFRHSMSLVTTLHNFLYADRAGNIAYFGDGLVPIEPPYSKEDPRLPAVGDGTHQWTGYVPFADMPHSVNPVQGYLDNWNTKPSAAQYYQQNGGDEYWGTIFRSSRISQLLGASHTIDIAYLEKIEHDIGQIDNGDNTRPAGTYFIPFLVAAYGRLTASHSPLVAAAAHPDLAPAIAALKAWNGDTTLGSPAMSIFMNFLEAYERNVFEGGLKAGETYTGAVNFDDTSIGMGSYGGLGGFATYNFLYHLLAHTSGLVPCGTQCYSHSYFAGHSDQLLVESLNDAIAILSGTGGQLGQNVPGFGTANVAKWGYHPAVDQNWDSLDPVAVGVTTHCGSSASQNRSTYMMAIEMNAAVTGFDVLPPGQSGFISKAGVASAHLCDQVNLFDDFTYKPMPPANSRDSGSRSR
jgi:penicillin amidase